MLDRRLIQCVYDNPRTMQRERYCTGEITCIITAAAIMSKRRPMKDPAPMLEVPWESGRIIGNPVALSKNRNSR